VDTNYTLDTPRPSDYFLVMPNQQDSAKKPKKQVHPNSLANLKPGFPKPGRPKGVLNKDTRTLKIAIAQFIDANHNRMQGWLDDIEATNGSAAAWDRFKDLLEYKLPKLARTEHTGPEGGPISVVQVSFQAPIKAAEVIQSQLGTLSPGPIETTQEEYSKSSDSNKGATD
jgi:hypothetical protein